MRGPGHSVAGFDCRRTRSQTVLMFAVVVDQLPGDVAKAAQGLATALGKTAYECRPIANAPGGGPVVVSCHALAPDAEVSASRLRAAGFETTVVPDTIAQPVRSFAARSFELRQEALAVQSLEGSHVVIPYAQVEVLVRGSELTQETQTSTSTTRKLDVGRAVLSGGLMMTRKQKTTRTTTSTDSQGFVIVYHALGPPVALLEKALLYQSLGPQMQPSRMANFVYLANRLRQRCERAVWDERLLRRAAQQQLLGATLAADDYLDLAIALVADSTQRRRQQPAG